MSQWLDELSRSGAVVVPAVLGRAEVQGVLEAISGFVDLEDRAGYRRLHEHAYVRELATSGALAEIARAAVGASGRAVRVLWFDKTPRANWSIPFHQDLTIAVCDRIESPGYGPWSIKDGITHVQPPSTVLEQMVAIRLHLDDCLADNGALRVVPGSHLLRRIPEAEIPEIIEAGEPRAIEARAGDAVVMRPLTLHASSPSAVVAHRRVLHVEYAGVDLPKPLEWFLGWQIVGAGG